jgi:hypothetical protein
VGLLVRKEYIMKYLIQEGDLLAAEYADHWQVNEVDVIQYNWMYESNAQYIIATHECRDHIPHRHFDPLSEIVAVFHVKPKGSYYGN